MPIATSIPSRPRTKQAFVYQTLRDAIMRCELAPGERLVIDDLARQLHVSAIPVREALRSLSTEGLVVNVPHVGATVAPLSRDSILEVFTLLEGLGVMAMRVVAERGSPEDFDALERLLRDMDDEVHAGREDEWIAHNSTFHTTIADLTGLPLLREMTARVHDRWRRVRRYFFRGLAPQRAEVAQGEHRQMLDAIRRGDCDRLYVLAHQHNRLALDSYLAYLDSTDRETGASATER